MQMYILWLNTHIYTPTICKPFHLHFILATSAVYTTSAQPAFSPSTMPYCAFDSLWEEEPLVDCVDGVIGFNITLLLQQDWSGVQTVIGPEHCEAALFVTMDQGPVCQRQQVKGWTCHHTYHNLMNMCITHQLIAEAPLWRGSREGW